MRVLPRTNSLVYI